MFNYGLNKKRAKVLLQKGRINIAPVYLQKSLVPGWQGPTVFQEDTVPADTPDAVTTTEPPKELPSSSYTPLLPDSLKEAELQGAGADAGRADAEPASTLSL